MILKIEKLIYGGDGLARLPSSHEKPASEKNDRGKAVFVPFVLAGEKIEAALTQEKSGFARARVQSIIESSPHRTAPPCPHFGSCGGCHYQHATYEHQLEIKRTILRENLRRIAKLDLQCEIATHPSPPWNYRNRSRLQVRTRPDFAAGYFKFASHQLLPIETCPISSPLINRGISALWQSGRAGKAVDGVQEVEFFANHDDSCLLVEFFCAPEARRAAVRAWAEDLCAAMPEIVGVSSFREPQKGVQAPFVAVGDSHLTYRTANASYRVSAGSFFQVNRFLVGELVDRVTLGRSGELALDLYAGVGLFSTGLSSSFRHTVSVEISQTAYSDLTHNLPTSGKAVQAATEEYLVALGETGRKAGDGTILPLVRQQPDLVVADPPRGGLGDRVAQALGKLNAPRVTYVSCDPATLARDLAPLQTAGYRVEEVHLLDLFPQTYHFEAVVQLVR